MSDLISREALKKAFEDTVCIEPMPYAFVKQIIDNAPTVIVDNYAMGYQDGVRQVLKEVAEGKHSPQGEWIPVSERLPKEEDYRPCYGLPDGCVMWQTDNGVIGFGWYYDSTKCWSDIYDHPITAGKVIAWQPLPEPYKKGGAE